MWVMLWNWYDYQVRFFVLFVLSRCAQLFLSFGQAKERKG